MSQRPKEEMWWQPQQNTPWIEPAADFREEEASTPFAALVAFTIILLLSPQNYLPALAPLRIALLAAGMAIASLLWDRWKRRQPLLRLTTEMFLVLALLAWVTLTLPLSYWPGGSVDVLTELYIKALAIFWLLPAVVTSMRRLRLLAMTMVICTVPLAVTALRNFASGNFLTDGRVFDRISGYQSGLTGNPNDLAFMLNLILPLGLALALSSNRPAVRLVWLVIVGLNVIAVILTFSRGGFLGLATIGFVCFIKLVRRRGPDRNWAFAMLMVATLSLPFLPSRYIDRLSTITDVEADPTGSSQTRWRDTVAAVRFIVDHPIIGAGLGMDVLALNDVRGTTWNAVHNVYLQYAVDLGLPGLILFLLLFWRVFRAARSSRRRAADTPDMSDLFYLAEGIEVSLIVFAIEGAFHPAGYHFYFYYIAGLALAAAYATNATISIAKASTAPGSETLVLRTA